MGNLEDIIYERSPWHILQTTHSTHLHSILQRKCIHPIWRRVGSDGVSQPNLVSSVDSGLSVETNKPFEFMTHNVPCFAVAGSFCWHLGGKLCRPRIIVTSLFFLPTDVQMQELFPQ